MAKILFYENIRMDRKGNAKPTFRCGYPHIIGGSPTQAYNNTWVKIDGGMDRGLGLVVMGGDSCS